MNDKLCELGNDVLWADDEASVVCGALIVGVVLILITGCPEDG